MKTVIQTINPYTQEYLQSYEYHSAIERESKISTAFNLYQKNLGKPLTISEKTLLLKKLSERLNLSKSLLVQKMVEEVGKPVTDANAEVEKSIVTIQYIADHLQDYLRSHSAAAAADFQLVKSPLGVVFAIMPWNYPLWQIVRVLGACVAIGNPVILKHADNVSGFAEELERRFSDELSGYLINLRIPIQEVESVIADPRIRGVSLTGSVRAGRSVGALAGKYLKKSVLELGGSDAYVVFADANIDPAAKICAQARMVNNGQSCVAAKRFVVHESIEKKFVTALIAELEKYVPGDPKNIATKVSCLAGRDFKKHLIDQCAMLEKNGAKLIWDLGNQTNIDKNHPTIFAARIYKVDKVNQEIANQELFGPVVMLHNFSSEDQAVNLVNSSCFGLGAAVFSEDREKAKRFALRLEAGIVGINSQVKSDVRYPFGGVKDSGYGRELGSVGFDEFVSHKVLINP